jgi:hypothetical protein
MLKPVVIALGLLLSSSLAQAADAVCYTTDDGEYPCWFEVLDQSGSFRISAPDRPTFDVWVEAPGVAFASAVFEEGGRSVSLPGTYYRSEEDGACWVSDATQAEICAW